MIASVSQSNFQQEAWLSIYHIIIGGVGCKVYYVAL